MKSMFPENKRIREKATHKLNIKQDINSDMGEVMDSTENSANPSNIVTISLWDQDEVDLKKYEEANKRTRNIRTRNMKKLESYSKNIAQISLETR